MDLITPKDCRNTYREILQGYTYIEEESFYIKHFKEADLGFIEYVYKLCEENVKKQGVPSLKEKLEFLAEEEYWTEEEESDYIQASLSVSDAYDFQRKLRDVKQKEAFQATIDHQTKQLEEIKQNRKIISYAIPNIISEQEEEDAHKWWTSHKCFNNEDNWKPDIDLWTLYPNIKLSPNSIGTVILVECPFCQESKNVTSFDNW